jgi:hypothetical protein
VEDRIRSKGDTATASEDASVWHRRFAAASNNRAWDLSVQSRTTAED